MSLGENQMRGVNDTSPRSNNIRGPMVVTYDTGYEVPFMTFLEIQESYTQNTEQREGEGEGKPLSAEKQPKLS